MNRKQAADNLDIITAFAGGADIQVRSIEVWQDIDTPVFTSPRSEYRIKPPVVPLTFAEAIDLMATHGLQTTGGSITFVGTEGLCISAGVLSWKEAMSLKFMDGTPLSREKT